MCSPCSVSSRECLYASAQPGPERNPTRPRPVSTPQSPLPGAASLVNDIPPFRPGYPSPSTTTSTGRRPTTAQPAVSPGGHLAQTIHRLDDGHQVHHVYSPDTVASELLTADLASTRWFDLLATDAAQADDGFTLAPSRPQTRPPSPSVEPRTTAAAYHASQPSPPSADPSAHTGQGPSSSVAPIVAPDHPDTSLERREWQLEEDICLRNEEVTLFRTFTERAALWLDLFDPYRHFSTYATRLAVSGVDFLSAGWPGWDSTS